MNQTELEQCFSMLQKGDKESLEAIYQELKVPMFTIIYRITHDKALSEDIMQDVFIKLYYSAPEAQNKNPRAWIFKIAHNLAIDRLRQPSNLDLSEEIADSIDFEDSVGSKMDLEEAMKRLSVEEREMVSLHINAGLKFKEISEITNIPLGTVLWKYQKALKKLRTYLLKGMSL